MYSIQGNSLYRTCAECPAEAGGRCPACHRWLCPDHFARQQHAPCAARQEQHAAEQSCYICGTPVLPTQWSLSLAAHYLDDGQCHGCGRAICTHHTVRQQSSDRIVRDGLRGLRYRTTRRYCFLCAPLRRWGGLVGATRKLLAVGTFLVSIAIILHH
jgi:hypothetical protein